MENLIKEILSKILKMGKVNTLTQVEQLIKVRGYLTTELDMVN